MARYGSLDAILAAAETGEGLALGKVRRDADYVRRAAEVVTIATDLPIEPLDLTRPRDLPRDEILAAAERVGLGGPLAALLDALA
ncbi:MAG: hypothetical protein ABR613_03770 [Actinomycetota bacterium]